jgi:thioredoxin reductase
MRARLERLRIPVREDRILRLEGRDGRLERIVFEHGAVEPREALFFATVQRQASDLAARLGCRFTKEGAVATGKLEATNVPGLFVCGDASRDAQLAIVAAAEGAAAAMAISKALLEAALAADQKSTSKPSRISLGGP